MSSSKRKPSRPQAERLSNDQFLEAVAERFKLLGEPMRLKLIRALFDGERTVSELVAATAATQANVSRHLSALAKVGILARRKEGLKAYYSIADPSIHELCEVVCFSMQQRREQLLLAWAP